MAPSSQLNILGPASSTTGINGYINDNYAGFSLFTYTHDNVFLAFDGAYNGANWISSQNNGIHRLNKNSGNLNFETSGTLTAGSAATTWTRWLQASNTGAVSFPLSAGVTFQTSGGTPTALNYYEEASFIISSSASSNPWGTTTNLTATALRIGGLVVIYVPSYFTNAAVAVSWIQFTGVPSRFTPTTYCFTVVTAVSGNPYTQSAAVAQVSAGSIFIWSSMQGGGFAATSTWAGLYNSATFSCLM